MKYPIVQQHSEEDCGAACLATVTKYYGRTLSSSRIREAVGMGARGTSLLGLNRGAGNLDISRSLLIVSLALGLLGFTSNPSSAQLHTLISQLPPPPPSTPLINTTRSGGSLNHLPCDSTNATVIALVPVKNPVREMNFYQN